MKQAALILTGAILATPATTFAADEGLEEVIVQGQLSRFSALKSDTPIMETARSISIISEQQILDRGALTLDDTFTYSAGVIGETYGYATRGDWVKVRGLDVPQYQDSLQSLFGNYNNTRPHVYSLEQVEILKGPASVLYGQGSPGGIVNVISKRPRAESDHELIAEVGVFDRSQIAIDSTGKISGTENWLYRVVGIYKDSGTQVDNVDEVTTVIAPSVSWRPNEDTDLTVLLNYTDSKSDTAAQFLPITGTLLPANNGQRIDSSAYLGEPTFNQYDATTLSATFLASHRFNDVWSMEFTSRYTDAKADYRQAWPSFIGGDRFVSNTDGSLYLDGTVPRSFFRSDATSDQIAVDARFRADFETGSVSHNVLGGIQYQDVTTGDNGYYIYALGYNFEPGAPSGTPGDTYWINVFNPVYGNVPPDELLNASYAVGPETTVEDVGLYLSDHATIGNWHLTFGARWDETESTTGSARQKDDAVSLSGGMLFQFENGLSPYVSYAESFEAVIGDNGQGQPLKPQEGEQVEVGLKYQPDSFPVFLTLAWFDLEQSNLADPLSLPGEFQQQSGVTSIDGVEFEGAAQLGEFRIQLNLSKLNTETADGWRLASVPEKQASTWVSWRPKGPLNGFKAGAGIRYVGESWGGVDQIRTPSYTLGDLMLGWEKDQWDLAVNVRNLSDKNYYATCLSRGDCFPGDQRSVVARVVYRF